MKRGPIALLIALTTTSAAALDIKGLEVDKPVNCEQINALESRQGIFAPSCENGTDRWFKVISFLSGKANMTLTQSPSRILLTIYVSNFDFDEAIDALTIKWGEPQIERSIIQNRFGASFDQVEATWRNGRVRLVLTKHGSQIDKPSLILMGAEALDSRRYKTIDRAQKNQGNI